MAYAARSLILSGSVPYAVDTAPCNFWRYATPDAAATVLTAGHFNGARDRLNVGDVIDAVCALGGTADRITVLVTAVPATGNVTVAVNTDASGA